MLKKKFGEYCQNGCLETSEILPKMSQAWGIALHYCIFNKANGARDHHKL